MACSRSFTPIGDDAPYASSIVRTWPYYDSKIVAEQEAEDFVRRHPQVELVTMRPTLVLGPGDDRRSSVTRLDECINGRIPLVPSGGLSYLDVRDAAAAFRAAMRKVVWDEMRGCSSWSAVWGLIISPSVLAAMTSGDGRARLAARTCSGRPT